VRIKSSQVRRLADALDAKAAQFAKLTTPGSLTEAAARVEVATLQFFVDVIRSTFKDAVAWVNITPNVRLEPLVLRGAKGDELAIRLYDKMATGDEPFYTWRPGELGPIEIVHDFMAYRVTVGKDKTLVIEACVE
jgi:hypothetical protein